MKETKYRLSPKLTFSVGPHTSRCINSSLFRFQFHSFGNGNWCCFRTWQDSQTWAFQPLNFNKPKMTCFFATLQPFDSWRGRPSYATSRYPIWLFDLYQIVWCRCRLYQGWTSSLMEIWSLRLRTGWVGLDETKEPDRMDPEWVRQDPVWTNK